MAYELLARLDKVISLMQQPSAGVPKDECYAIIQQVEKEWGRADTEPKRVALLEVLKGTYDVLQSTLCGEDIRGFAEYRDKLYKTLLLSEAVIGYNVSTSRLDAVTTREVLAGRMNEEHDLRKFTVISKSAPYLTDKELYAMASRKEKVKEGWLGKIKSLFKR